MDITLIKKLVKIVEESQITDFSVEEGELKIKISKSAPQPTHYYAQPINPEAAAPVVNIQQPVTVQESKVESANVNLHEIRSPIVGTFYRAPSPDADSYVQVGDSVSVGSVLCIVEAMKLMNEIESDANGKIVKILVENASPVEYNQPLFLVEKI